MPRRPVFTWSCFRGCRAKIHQSLAKRKVADYHDGGGELKEVVEGCVFVDRTRVETLQPTQTTAGGEEMEVGVEGDTEAGGQIRTVGVSLSSVHGLGEIPVRIISTLYKAL